MEKKSKLKIVIELRTNRKICEVLVALSSFVWSRCQKLLAVCSLVKFLLAHRKYSSSFFALVWTHVFGKVQKPKRFCLHILSHFETNSIHFVMMFSSFRLIDTENGRFHSAKVCFLFLSRFSAYFNFIFFLYTRNNFAFIAFVVCL